jgi:arsenite methyltransferase
VEELKRILGEAGFTDIVVQEKDNTDEIIRSWNFGEDVEKMVFTAYVKARKPSGSI